MHHITIGSVVEFVLVGVILKSLIAKALMDLFYRFIKRLLIKSEKDLAVFLHYKNLALNKDHHREDDNWRIKKL